jgi:hypothetical protein
MALPSSGNSKFPRIGVEAIQESAYLEVFISKKTRMIDGEN